jgi:hypothetical protein
VPPTDTLGSDGAAAVFSSVNGLCIQGDVLTSPYNNAKGAGLVGLLGTEGGKGLFALLVNNGNTDKLTINTIDPGTGKIAALGSVSLGSSIHQNVWYRVVAFATLSACDGAGASLCEIASGEIASGDLLITATVYAHETPTNPDSELVTPALGMVEITRSLSELGINAEGFVGMAGWAKSSPVNSSITNFRAFDDCGITVK